MKYIFAYKTSDGARHEDSMEAASREEVFDALRKRGIKAIKVIAADGSKANGEVRGVRKRVVAAAIIFAIVATATSLILLRPDDAPEFETAQTRRQVIGDEAIIEKGIRTGWADVFKLEGERFLASFAIPGVKAGQRNTTEAEIRRALETKTPVREGDSLEARQIKAMVAGMKAEARAYIAAGGSIVGYGKRLTERQDAEIAVYTRARNELDAAQKTLPEKDFDVLLEQRNDELRNLGIKPITFSE